MRTTKPVQKAPKCVMFRMHFVYKMYVCLYAASVARPCHLAFRADNVFSRGAKQERGNRRLSVFGWKQTNKTDPAEDGGGSATSCY